jgi:hypothetical protein
VAPSDLQIGREPAHGLCRLYNATDKGGDVDDASAPREPSGRGVTEAHFRMRTHKAPDLRTQP